MSQRLNRYFKKEDTPMSNRNLLVIKDMQIKNHIERPLHVY